MEKEQPLPDPLLLKIHASLAQIIEASAARSYILNYYETGKIR